MSTRFAFFMCAGLACSAAAALGDDPRIDPSTGRELANYAPARHFDFRHMRLEMDIPDIEKPAFTAVQTYTVAAIGRERAELVLDAGSEVKIESVKVAGALQGFQHSKKKLRIQLAAPVPAGKSVDVQIRYAATAKKPDGSGLTWTKGNPKGKTPTDKAAQIHSQGQPQTNSEWFPCHDFPNERMTTELLVTVEDGYLVGSNGRLVRSTLGNPASGGRPRTTWHWLQDKPHAAYLVSLVVGRFAVVGLPAEIGPGSPGAAPCYLYAPIGLEKAAAATYATTPAMLACFERLFDEPYPWDQYSQSLVRRFAAGGMENTSATTMPHDSANAGGQWEDVIAHEAGHQWAGDLVTCNSWEHVWLNEGWASYCEAIWAEQSAPKGKAKREYQKKIASFISRQRMLNGSFAPDHEAMVSKRWGDPFEAFMRPNDPYAKGAVVIHMVRQMLGDELFFKAVALYIDRHALGEVETDDFRHCMEEVSGLSLERFFAQWCHRPGVPRLEAEIDWKEQSPGESGQPTRPGELTITVRQMQTIDRDNPAYAFTLPVVINTEGGSRTIQVEIDSKETVKTVRLEAKPRDVVFDPEMTVAAATKIKKDLAMWMDQLGDDSVFAQLQAVEGLADHGDSEAVAALLGVALDAGQDACVRRAAADSLRHSVILSTFGGAVAVMGGN
jgi:aminopeptidase N